MQAAHFAREDIGKCCDCSNGANCQRRKQIARAARENAEIVKAFQKQSE